MMTEKEKEEYRKLVEQEEIREEKGAAWVKENQLEFGKFYVIYGIPSIELVKPDGRKKYLSAFRLYSFQVSDTRRGTGAAGNTPVFGLKTFQSITQLGPSNLNQEHTVKFLIESAAYQAIYDYCNNNYLWAPHDHVNHFRCNEEWQKFIDAVYDVVVNGYELQDTKETDDESVA